MENKSPPAHVDDSLILNRGTQNSNKENNTHQMNSPLVITQTETDFTLTHNATPRPCQTDPEMESAKRNLSPASMSSNFEPSAKKTADDSRAINANQQQHLPPRQPETNERGYPVEVACRSLSSCQTRRDLVQAIENIKPQGTVIKEILKTQDGRFLVFAGTYQDYNHLLDISRWTNAADDPISTKIAPKQGSSGKAVVIANVDEDIETEEILESLRRQNFHATSANRLKRAKDGAPTRSVKVFMEDEKEIDSLINKRFYCRFTRHNVSRYNPPRWTQCYKCQAIGHASNSCTSDNRKCMKCALPHHHRQCLKNQSEYLCANCGGAHAANDSRCQHIKLALETDSSRQPNRQPAAAPAATTTPPPTSSSAPIPPPPLNAWGPIPGQILPENPITRSELQSVISVTLQTEMSSFKNEFLQAMVDTFERSLSKIAENFAANIERYREKIKALENVISDSESFANSLNKTIIESKPEPATSTPLPDRSHASGSDSCLHGHSAANQTVITEGTGALFVRLPPANLQLTKGSRKIEIEKLIKQQLKSMMKLMEKEIEDVMPEIKNRFSNLTAIRPQPRRRTSSTSNSTPSTTSTGSEAETSDGRKKEKRKRTLTGPKIKRFNPKGTPPPNRQQQQEQQQTALQQLQQTSLETNSPKQQQESTRQSLRQNLLLPQIPPQQQPPILPPQYHQTTLREDTPR